MQEKLLGFDARHPSAHSDDLWDEARRERFLLRADAPAPLSVDVMVWPSLFDFGQGIGLVAAERRRLHLAGIPTPPWIGPNASLWESLEGLRQYLAKGEARGTAHVLIAVTWLSERDFGEAGPGSPYLSATTPAGLDRHWPLLGFDVADGAQLSGLSNCGYSAEEAATLRPSWVPHLNAAHLFADSAPAFRFRHLADQRIPEHAPFFVYGLYRIGEAPIWSRAAGTGSHPPVG